MAYKDGLDDIHVVIEELKDRFTPNKRLMNSIAEEMHASVMNNFQTQGASVPGGWPALKPATLKAKRKKGFSEAILQAQGFLIRSLQSSATNDTSMVSTNKIQARILNDGGVISITARTRTLFHRTDAKGNLLKQTDNKNLLVFAKESHKRKAAYTFGQKNYNITIPPRPFMVLTDTYKNNIINKIRAHILNA